MPKCRYKEIKMISQLNNSNELVILINHLTKMIYELQEQVKRLEEKK